MASTQRARKPAVGKTSKLRRYEDGSSAYVGAGKAGRATKHAQQSTVVSWSKPPKLTISKTRKTSKRRGSDR